MCADFSHDARFLVRLSDGVCNEAETRYVFFSRSSLEKLFYMVCSRHSAGIIRQWWSLSSTRTKHTKNTWNLIQCACSTAMTQQEVANHGGNASLAKVDIKSTYIQNSTSPPRQVAIWNTMGTQTSCYHLVSGQPQSCSQQ